MSIVLILAMNNPVSESGCPRLKDEQGEDIISQITNYQLPITNYQLPITHYPLPVISSYIVY